MDSFTYSKKTFEEENLLIKAQKIAKDSIKKEHWTKYDGKFWDMLETRPYMRAKACYAEFLWMDMFAEESAIQILEELLLLDTMDRMGLRFILMSWYLRRESYDKMSNLYTDFPKDRNNPLFLYPVALMNFIQNGSQHPTTHEFIQKALISNIRIGDSLLLEEMPDPAPPTFYVKHSQEESKYFLEIDEGLWYE